ncbi:MAG: HAMP domain-containing sensor histidine kinase [Gemmatimonadota bacterium]
MNAAFVLSACVAVLHAGIGALLLPVSRAPGWRGARMSAVIAFSAAAYGAASLATAYAPLDDSVRMLASQFSYVAAAIFVSAWLVSAYGGDSASVRRLPRWVKGLAALTMFGGALAMVLRPWFFSGSFSDVEVAWAGVRYRFATPSVLGSLTTFLFLTGVLVASIAFCRPRGEGKRATVGYRIGFSIFFLASLIEVLVANGLLNFLFIADLGFLAVVTPLAAQTTRRFMDDARRLSVASTYLTEEIERRTEERDEAQQAWIEAERQAALGRLAAGVGHEINNPLAYLRLNVELMGVWGREHGSPEELMESVEGALDGADRIRGVVDALRAYSRPHSGALVPIAPELFTQAALKVTAHKLRDVAEVHTAIDSAPEVLGDEGRLVQVMVNLLLNAAQSHRERVPGANSRIGVRVGTTIDGKAMIEVSDNGPGISREDLRRLTQPYFSARFEGGGMGLGLFLARGVVEQLGGLLEIESEVGTGTLVRILLPAAEETPASALEPVLPRSGAVPVGSRVLVARGVAVGR